MAISKSRSRSLSAIVIGMAVLFGLAAGRPTVADQFGKPAPSFRDPRAAIDPTCTAVGDLDQRLVKQTALTVWLNANTIALEILWQQYVGGLISDCGIPEGDAVRVANTAVSYGALNAKEVLRDRGRPVANLLLDGAGFYETWEASHRRNPERCSIGSERP